MIARGDHEVLRGDKYVPLDRRLDTIEKGIRWNTLISLGALGAVVAHLAGVDTGVILAILRTIAKG